MKLEVLPEEFSICQLTEVALPQNGVYFLGVTGQEISLVCESAALPPNAQKTEGGWRAFRVAGPLDFSHTGILASLSGTLAAAGIPLFAVSTFDTDYLLVKAPLLPKALACLGEKGWAVEG